MEEKNYKAFGKAVEKTLKLKKQVDLFEDTRLFIVYVDANRLTLFVEFLNKNDVIIRYIVKIKNGKAVIYNSLLTGSNPLKPTMVDIYETTVSASNVAIFFKGQLKEFKKSIDKQ